MSIISRPGYFAFPIPVAAIVLVVAHQLLAAAMFTFLQLSRFFGGPMFDLWTTKFLFEEYWIFWGRWDVASVSGSALSSVTANIVSASVVVGAVIYLWHSEKTNEGST